MLRIARARALGATFACLALALGGASAASSDACSVTGLQTLSVAASGAVQPGGVRSFRIDHTTPGDHYLLVLAAGDVDVEVCKVGEGTVCESGNLALLPDGCLANGLNSSPGVGRPLHGAGTYRLDIEYCFDASCGYVDTGTPVAYAAISR